jgi:protein ImuA
VVALPAAVAAAVWCGDQLGSAPASTRPSGFAALDAELPGGGWPCQGLTEILSPHAGALEWRLLAPLLRSLTQAGQPVVVVGPPRPPHPPGLRADGVDERALVWVQAETPAERLWATEQLVRGHVGGVLVAWLPQVRPEQLRRLQVLAAAGRGPVFVCRPETAARESSAAPLRLLARVGPGWTLQVDLLKRRGPPLAHTLTLPSVPGGLAGWLTPRLLRPAATRPLAPALGDGHVVVSPVAARSGSAVH